MRLLVISLLTGLAFAPASAQPREVASTEHRAAQADFPERIGEFRRGRVVQYDAEGLNMSAGYDLEWPEGRLTVTVYIYPAVQAGANSAGERESACRSEFSDASNHISQTYPESRRLSADEPRVVPGAARGLSHRSVFNFRVSFDGREQTVRSELDLYCYVGDRWFVKFRATGSETVAADDAIDMFIRNGPWPGRRPPTSIAVSQPAPIRLGG